MSNGPIPEFRTRPFFVHLAEREVPDGSGNQLNRPPDTLIAGVAEGLALLVAHPHRPLLGTLGTLFPPPRIRIPGVVVALTTDAALPPLCTIGKLFGAVALDAPLFACAHRSPLQKKDVGYLSRFGCLVKEEKWLNRSVIDKKLPDPHLIPAHDPRLKLGCGSRALRSRWGKAE